MFYKLFSGTFSLAAEVLRGIGIVLHAFLQESMLAFRSTAATMTELYFL
jgi:hypothetical protein